MVMEWSHTQEAYSNAYENLHRQDRDWLLEVYGEWVEAEGLQPAPDSINADFVADAVWAWMTSARLCSNDFRQAWACPYGCHTVTFDKVDEMSEARAEYQNQTRRVQRLADEARGRAHDIISIVNRLESKRLRKYPTLDMGAQDDYMAPELLAAIEALEKAFAEIEALDEFGKTS